MRKRRKGGFEAQQVLLLLSLLAHNLLIWCKEWLVDAVAASGVKAEKQTPPEGGAAMTQTIATIESRGIKRLLREVLWLCGKVIFKNGRVVCIILTPLYPLIDRIITAFQAFLKPYKIRVLLDET